MVEANLASRRNCVVGASFAPFAVADAKPVAKDATPMEEVPGVVAPQP